MIFVIFLQIVFRILTFLLLDSYVNLFLLQDSRLEFKAKIGKIYSLKNDGSVYCSGTLCPTLIAGMGKFPDRIPVVKDNYGIRRLTIREFLRFQGFLENFNISRENSIEDAYKQIGNSVCVPRVNRIAIEIAKVLERKVL